MHSAYHLHPQPPTHTLVSAFLRARFSSLLSILGLFLLVFSLVYSLRHFSRPSLDSSLLSPLRSPQHPFTRPSPITLSHAPLHQLDPNDYSDTVLLSLPILRRTSNNPFDPINHHRTLADSQNPWNKSSSTGASLLARLRHPPPSKPPPSPVWPPPNAIPSRSRTPIPHDRILNFSDATSSRLPPMPGSKRLASVQWAGFKRPGGAWETPEQTKTRNTRRGWVRNAFQHVWEGYKARAWGHDELRPISGKVSLEIWRCDFLSNPTRVTSLTPS